MRLFAGLIWIFAILPFHGLTQGLSTERIAKIKECTVRITINGIAQVGTGFLISEDGLVATSWHVVQESIYYDDQKKIKFHQIYAEYKDGSKVEMSIPNYFLSEGNIDAVAYDYCMLSPDKKVNKKTAFLKIGKFENINDGDEVYTCGYPLAISQQFISKGILSTKFIQIGNYVNKDGDTLSKPRDAGWFDLTLNKGNSGGAVVKIGNTIDEDEVIGMAVFILSPALTEKLSSKGSRKVRLNSNADKSI